MPVWQANRLFREAYHVGDQQTAFAIENPRAEGLYGEQRVDGSDSWYPVGPATRRSESDPKLPFLSVPAIEEMRKQRTFLNRL